MNLVLSFFFGAATGIKNHAGSNVWESQFVLKADKTENKNGTAEVQQTSPNYYVQISNRKNCTSGQPITTLPDCQQYATHAQKHPPIHLNSTSANENREEVCYWSGTHSRLEFSKNYGNKGQWICQGDYVYGFEGVETCPGGNDVIIDENECSTYAHDRDITYEIVDDVSQSAASFCFLKSSGDGQDSVSQLHFGTPGEDVQRICAEDNNEENLGVGSCHEGYAKITNENDCSNYAQVQNKVYENNLIIEEPICFYKSNGEVHFGTGHGSEAMWICKREIEYVQGGEGEEYCPSGSDSITNENDCSNYAQVQNKVYLRENSSADSICYLKSNGKVHFGTGHGSEAKWICKQADLLYIVGHVGDDSCSPSSDTITNQNECLNFATDRSLTYHQEILAQRYAICYLEDDEVKFGRFWNESQTTWICQKESSSLTYTWSGYTANSCPDGKVQITNETSCYIYAQENRMVFRRERSVCYLKSNGQVHYGLGHGSEAKWICKNNSSLMAYHVQIAGEKVCTNGNKITTLNECEEYATHAQEDAPIHLNSTSANENQYEVCYWSGTWGRLEFSKNHGDREQWICQG